MENQSNLGPSQDDGKAPWTLGANHSFNAARFHFEDVFVEEEEGGKGLVLRGGGNAPFHRQMGEEGIDFTSPHFAGMAFVVKEDESFGPIGVGRLGPQTIVTNAASVPHLIEQARRSA